MAGSQKGPGRRRVGGRAVRAGQRRRRSKLKIGIVISVSLLVLLVAGTGWIYVQLDGDIADFRRGRRLRRPAACLHQRAERPGHRHGCADRRQQ